MRRFLTACAAVLAVLVAAGCAGARSAAPRSDEPDVVLVVDATGPWKVLPLPAADGNAPNEVAAQPAEREVIEVPPPGLHAPARPRLAVPKRRATPQPAALGTRPAKSLRDLARERYLDHPTRVKARRITFYCPQVFAQEVRLTADDSQQTNPTRRVASGRARLVCRELTLEADQIVLRIRTEANADVQVSARGSVDFITDQRGQILRENGVRTLILTNEKIVPLR